MEFLVKGGITSGIIIKLTKAEDSILLRIEGSLKIKVGNRINSANDILKHKKKH